MKMSMDATSRHEEQQLSPDHLLDRFVDLFRGHNMLNRMLKISHRNRIYRIYCGEDRFLAYRVNPNPGIPPGIPGWITCLVTQEAVMDSSADTLGHEEPGVKDWLNCIAEGSYHHI
jgi:hypothetical protein